MIIPSLSRSGFMLWALFLYVCGFVFDVFSPLPAVGCFYVTVIALALWARLDSKKTFLAAGLACVLILAAFVFSLPYEGQFQDIPDHLLTMAFLFTVALSSIMYQRQKEYDKHLRSILQATNVAFVQCSGDGVICSWKGGAEDIYGYSAYQIEHHHLEELFHPDRRDEAAELLVRLRSGLNIEGYETEQVRKDGRVFHVSLALLPELDDNGELRCFYYVAVDVSEIQANRVATKKVKEQLADERRRLKDIMDFLEYLRDPADAQALIQTVVNMSVKIFGIERCSFIFLDRESGQLKIKGSFGLDPRIVQAANLAVGDPISGQVAERGKPVLVKNIEQDNRFRRSNRSTYKTKSFMSVPIPLKGDVVGVINVADKVNREVFSESEFKLLQIIGDQVARAVTDAHFYEELKQLADGSEGVDIASYQLFTRAIKREVKRFHRYQEPFCLFYLDIDDFHLYKEDFGQQQAERLLKNVEKALKRNLRDVDLVFHYSGDEFAVLLPKTDLEQCRVVADRLVQNLKELSLYRPITFCIGVAQYEEGFSYADLIMHSLRSLQKAKKGGRHQVYLAKREESLA